MALELLFPGLRVLFSFRFEPGRLNAKKMELFEKFECCLSLRAVNSCCWIHLFEMYDWHAYAFQVFLFLYVFFIFIFGQRRRRRVNMVFSIFFLNLAPLRVFRMATKNKDGNKKSRWGRGGGTPNRQWDAVDRVKCETSQRLIWVFSAKLIYVFRRPEKFMYIQWTDKWVDELKIYIHR